MVLQALLNSRRHRWHVGVAALAIAVYAATWLGWARGWSWVVITDSWALGASQRAALEHDHWVFSWNVLCTIFSPLAFRLATLGVIAVVLWRRRTSSPGRSAPARRTSSPGRRYRVALFLFLSVELSAVVTEIAKGLARRPRPITSMTMTLGTSFPSGHALGSLVAVLSLAVVLAPHVRRRLWPWAIAAAVLVVVLVGVGRVALNVHHPSDVVAGWALGYLYFAVCLPVLGRRDPVTAPDGTPVGPGTAP